MPAGGYLLSDRGGAMKIFAHIGTLLIVLVGSGVGAYLAWLNRWGAEPPACVDDLGGTTLQSCAAATASGWAVAASAVAGGALVAGLRRAYMQRGGLSMSRRDKFKG